MNAVTRRKLWFCIGVFVLAALVRFWAVNSYATTPTADAADYHRLAAGLSNGLGYVNEAGTATAWRPPGYPIFLAGIYSLFGPSVRAATIVQALLGAMTALLLAYLSWLIIGPREAIIAGVIAAVYPSLFWLSRLLLSENVALFLLLASLCVGTILLRSKRSWWAAALGVLLGFTVLVRGASLLFALIMVVGVVIALIKRRAALKRIAAITLLTAVGLAVTFLPWIARNYRVFGRFVPVATQDGIGLYSSYWPPVRNGKMIWGTLPGTEDPHVEFSSRLGSEVAASKYLQQVTIQRLRQEPGYFFQLIPSKMASLLVPFDWEVFPHADGRSRSVNYGYLFLLPFALIGFIALCRQRPPDWWLLWLLPVTILVQAVVFYGSPRFRLPAELMAIILAAVGLASTYAFLKSRKSLLGLKLNLFG